ncbi:MAG: type IV pilus assembly protein PilN [Cellvibrionaceae bacterium]|jgi:type IV pilus assembly protein PilN
MANINLLPWRDEYRQEKKWEFLLILGSLCLLGLIVASGWFALTEASISNQETRNALLKKEIALLEKKVKEIEGLQKRREELEIRIGIIQDLQLKRPLVVHYFDETVKAVPEGIFFKNIARIGNEFEIEGITKSNNRVSDLMRNLDRSPWFAAPNLQSVIADEFKLSVRAIAPETEDGKEG